MSGVIYYEFLKQGKTITSDVMFCEQLDKMNEKLKIQHPALINRKVPLLLPHTSKLTVQKLKDLGYETLPHPPYSPDIAPTDFGYSGPRQISSQENLLKARRRLKMPFESLLSPKIQAFTNLE